jgi:hypothetical protein
MHAKIPITRGKQVVVQVGTPQGARHYRAKRPPRRQVNGLRERLID